MKEDWNKLNPPAQKGWLINARCFGKHEIFRELAMTSMLQSNVGDVAKCLIDGGWHFPQPYSFAASRIKSHPLEIPEISLPSGIIGKSILAQLVCQRSQRTCRREHNRALVSFSKHFNHKSSRLDHDLAISE